MVYNINWRPSRRVLSFTKKTKKAWTVMLCALILVAIFVVEVPTTTQALTKKTIYVDTSGIDARTDLTAAQKTDLKNKIIADIVANLGLAVGSENVEVTTNPAKKAGASRKVEIKNSFGSGAWGGRMPGSDTAEVYLKEFLDDPNVADDFKTGGNWDMDKLANGIGHTAGHELGHTFSVGHNKNTGADINKMTDGNNYGANEKANNVWVYDDHTDKVMQKNWEKKACAAKVDYEMKALVMHYWGEEMLPGKPEEYGGLNTLFSFSGPLASEFYLVFLGPDSDGGLYDGDSEFDFIYKSSMEGLGADAQMLTFFEGSHDYTQFLLEGKPGSPWEGQWFMLGEYDLHLDNFVTQPWGLRVARTVVMEWDIDGISGSDVQVMLDANAFGEYSNPYNGFTDDYVLAQEYKSPLGARPKVDQHQWQIMRSPDERLLALVIHEVDAGWVRPEDVNVLIAAGFTIIEEEGRFWAFTGPYDSMPGAIGIVNMAYYGPLASSNGAGKVLGRADRYEDGKEINKWILPDFIHTLNPLTAKSESAWQVLSSITDGLFGRNPYTWEFMWWAAEGEPVVEDWIGPGRAYIGGNEVYDAPFNGTHYNDIPVENVTETDLVGDDQLGMVTTWTLRDGMYWHDSDPGPDMVFDTADDGVKYPVTVEDLRFGLDLLRFQENERHFSTWEFIYAVAAVDYNTLKIFEEQRSSIQALVLALEGHNAGLLAPKHIWELFIQPTIYLNAIPVIQPDGTTTYADEWIDWVNHHEDWFGWEDPYMPCPIHPGETLTYLIGFGPFHYHYEGLAFDSVHIEANYAYFVGPICPGDVDFNQKVEISDWSIVIASFGKYGAPNYDVRADIQYPAQEVDLDEIYAVMFTHFGHWWGPGPVPPGFEECPS